VGTGLGSPRKERHTPGHSQQISARRTTHLARTSRKPSKQTYRMTISRKETLSWSIPLCQKLATSSYTCMAHSNLVSVILQANQKTEAPGAVLGAPG